MDNEATKPGKKFNKNEEGQGQALDGVFVVMLKSGLVKYVCIFCVGCTFAGWRSALAVGTFFEILSCWHALFP